MDREEFLKTVVKFFVLRYITTLVVSRTVTGKHKEAYISPGLEDALEYTIDVMRDHRGEYLFIDNIVEEVAKRMGFSVKRPKASDVPLKITRKIPGRKRGVEVKYDQFRRVVNYALNASRELFELAELVKRPSRDTPERFIAVDRRENITNRLNMVSDRIQNRLIESINSDGAYVCSNMSCKVLELYRGMEAEENSYICKGKTVTIVEYSDQGRVEEKRLDGCNNFLDEVDTEILENVVALLNKIAEKL